MSDANNPPPKNKDNLPTKQALDQLLRTAIKDILQPGQQKQVIERLGPKLELIIQSSYHSGPIPSVDTARGYEAITPGSVDRIIRMAEKDQDAVIQSAAFKARKDSQYRTLCMVFGFGALVLLLGAMIFLAFYGHKEVALGVAGLGAVGVISTFVNARFSKE